MNNEDRFLELLEKASDKEKAIEIAIVLMHALSRQFQTATETDLETPRKKIGTSVA